MIKGRKYKLSPLPPPFFRRIIELGMKCAAAAHIPTLKSVREFGDFIHASIQVRRPDVTRDLIDEMTIQEVSEAMMKISEITIKSIQRASTGG
jgi:hypothetical protein